VGLPKGWRQSPDTLSAGPIAWLGLGRPNYGRNAVEPHGSLAPAVKAMLTIRDGTRARVVIPTDERTRLSLDYNDAVPQNARLNLYRVNEGTAAVTFAACSRTAAGASRTNFAGGFIVAGPQCARIAIYPGGSGQPTWRRVAFGVPARGCSTAS
jgi:hypothetical protein